MGEQQWQEHQGLNEALMADLGRAKDSAQDLEAKLAKVELDLQARNEAFDQLQVLDAERQQELAALKNALEFRDRQAAQDARQREHLDGNAYGLDFDELRVQNRELNLTMQQFKQDCELLDVENCSLRNRLESFENDLERVTSQNATLIGHVNHKQKIRHTLQLKDEISRLRVALQKAHEQIVTLEVSKRSADFCEALYQLGLSLNDAAQSDVEPNSNQPQQSPSPRPSPARYVQNSSVLTTPKRQSQKRRSIGRSSPMVASEVNLRCWCRTCNAGAKSRSRLSSVSASTSNILWRSSSASSS